MNIQLKTKVKGHYKDIMARFDRDLFEALAPGFPPMEIVEFSGSREGDKVHIRFGAPVNAEWVSLITDHGVDESEAYFVDEGMKLPPPLSYWKHRHIVRKITEDTSCIIDDITFRGPNRLLTWLMYPGILLGFYPRKKIYRAYFGRGE